MDALIEGVKQDFQFAKEGILRALGNTPDDRLNWSPSPTSRTPLNQVVHSAASVAHLHNTMAGRTFSVPTREEADVFHRNYESQFKTREQAIELMEANSAAYLDWLDTLTTDRFDEMVLLPFDLGSAPMRLVITFPALHTRMHHAQLDYIQTIYGDLDWHA